MEDGVIDESAVIVDIPSIADRTNPPERNPLRLSRVKHICRFSVN